MSLRKTGGFKYLLKFDLRARRRGQRFDQFGHFLRALLRSHNCFDYASIPQSGCSANFCRRRRERRRRRRASAAPTPSASRRHRAPRTAPASEAARHDRSGRVRPAAARAAPRRPRPTRSDGHPRATGSTEAEPLHDDAARRGPGRHRRRVPSAAQPQSDARRRAPAARLPDRRAPPAPREASDEAPRRDAGIAASPTMVGALTVMVVILAVFLAYNANNGLPFVPTYRISVEVPERRPARARQRGPDRRRPRRRWSSRSSRSRTRTATSAPGST